MCSSTLLAEYAYVLAPGGLLYTVTDVRDLYEWQAGTIAAHPMFEMVSDDELKDDPCVPLILNSSEEVRIEDRSVYTCKLLDPLIVTTIDQFSTT